jgi:hypothetical protein
LLAVPAVYKEKLLPSSLLLFSFLLHPHHHSSNSCFPSKFGPQWAPKQNFSIYTYLYEIATTKRIPELSEQRLYPALHNDGVNLMIIYVAATCVSSISGSSTRFWQTLSQVHSPSTWRAEAMRARLLSTSPGATAKLEEGVHRVLYSTTISLQESKKESLRRLIALDPRMHPRVGSPEGILNPKTRTPRSTPKLMNQIWANRSRPMQSTVATPGLLSSRI